MKSAYLLYQFVSRVRVALYQKNWLQRRRLRKPVISVGNIAFGGSGKTPFVMRLASELMERGRRVSILSRGYKRRGKGLVPVSDGVHVVAGVDEAGDEAYLLAKALPGACVTVCENRHAAGEFAETKHAVDVHILDDGFQHVQLERDLDIVLMRGDEDLALRRWREPLEALHRAHLLVLTGDAWPVEEAMARHYPDLPLCKMRSANYGFVNAGGNAVSLDCMKEHRWIALAGIARPERFFEDLQRVPLNIVKTISFPDHHRPSAAEVERLRGDVKALACRGVIMTQKDFHKWDGKGLELFYSRVGFPPLPGWVMEKVLKVL